MKNLLTKEELPDWFNYPHQFLRIVNQNLTDLDPWYVLAGNELRDRYNGLKSRYPARNIIPFAKNSGSDDIACWDKTDVDKVFIVHDYASDGWENREIYSHFWDWFRAAIEDTIDYEP